MQKKINFYQDLATSEPRSRQSHKRLGYKNQSIIGVVYLILRHYAKGN